ncbi:MAG TPA: UvrD-helicase domain-containing protein, partial [Actinomycetospora sp.]|nr:UvrD-helicase domain-containing protein [Actinomycetospora sp.]
MSTGRATRPPESATGSDAPSGPPVRSAASALSRRLASAAAGGGDAGAGGAVRRDAGRPGGTADDPLLEGMNPPQREAVVHTGSPLLIVAGAGSGKTRVLTHRIAWQMRHQGVGPGQFLAITFTNKAAAEMRERVAALVGRRANAMWVSTFHSMCVRILRREYRHLELSSTFSIYDADDSRRLVASVARGLDLDAKKYSPRGLLARISAWKNELVSPVDAADAATTEAEKRTAEVYAVYQQRLQQSNSLDFDDLIGRTVDLLTRFPDVAEYYRRRFRHILVDEYQDTNHAQYALIRELTRAVEPDVVAELDQHGVLVRGMTDATGRIPGASLTVVGDSDQSIYAFRGADIRNIVEFERDFPGAKVVLLEQNYRSTQNILSAANAVISNNFDRKDKKLWTADGDGEKITGYTGYTAHDEAQFVVDEIEALHRAGVAYRDMAVFYRTNAQTRALEEIFVRSAVPYRVVGGTKFYERAEIKDAMAYLIAVANPLDELALRRILNT